MNTAAAAPATTTAPATVAGTETSEVTMITLTAARAALDAIEAEVAYLMSCDDEAFDADLAERHEAALRDLRAAQAREDVAEAWIVWARNLDTHRTLRTRVVARTQAEAFELAAPRWAGKRVLMDAARPARMV